MESSVPPHPPPLGSAPPVLTPPPWRPPPRRPGRVWIFVILGLVGLLLVGSLVFLSQFAGNFAALLGSPLHSGPHLEEILVEQNHSAHKIVVVPVEGMIFSQGLSAGESDMVKLIELQLKKAARDSAVRAVILRIDSPGGEVLASDEIANAVARFQTTSKKPVIAAMGSLAASGGYYVAAPCRWIVANELTLTGSIGVIFYGLNYRGLMNKVGVRPQIYKSGRFKDMLSGSKDLENLTPEERETYQEEQRMVLALVSETFAKFKSVVETGRRRANDLNQTSGDPGRVLSRRWTEYADGRILSGKEAHDLGFVDELGNWDVAQQRARTLAQIADANLVTYQPPFDFTHLFRLFGRAERATIQVDLGLDAPKLKAGRLYFLSPLLVP